MFKVKGNHGQRTKGNQKNVVSQIQNINKELGIIKKNLRSSRRGAVVNESN